MVEVSRCRPGCESQRRRLKAATIGVSMPARLFVTAVALTSCTARSGFGLSAEPGRFGDHANAPGTILASDFEAGADLSGWDLTDVVGGSVTFDDAGLVLHGTTGPRWNYDQTGMAITVPVEGDYVVVTEMIVSAASDSTAVPPPDCTAGQMAIAEPQVPGQRFWTEHGAGNFGSVVGTGWRGTTDSSTFILVGSGTRLGGEFRLCRLGNTVRLYRRLEGDSVLSDGSSRMSNVGPASATVNSVGLTIGCSATPADIVATFAYVFIETVATQADCEVDYPW
jgi:hypothetical protein